MVLRLMRAVSHDTSGSLDTKGKRGNVEEKDLLRGVTRKDCSLDGSAIGNSLIEERVDEQHEGLRKDLYTLVNPWCEHAFLW